ncbi:MULTISPECIES: HU family DNA-binding protein [Acetomicrobium]|jgi:DNA-binding protein HU-beta|uniref:HU family DNA-binding protein n=1 Tax=Acetomicrobium TaxID=49894 RepID=UPI0016ADD522|nr:MULTISPECIES: HU family DNA-binding protein [Acetomicrobium]MDI9376849.1 HU family DNA-binding protein [Synergistota bacterium]NLI42071.1 HU family DNA-binding protein [Synergistaceae bacterium]MDR9770636.1 HU family DNA-binding protein [Acetomicrobium sp.]HOB10157.1 HU family DNA-binding protein [Acetomicrobium sp.]HQA36448.1 HU family DNA-binding protein [Acetomicrobium sp.]
MTKSDIVNEVAKATGLTKKDAASAVDAFVKCVVEALSKGEEVQIMGFGTFEVRNRAARKGRNPQNPEEVIDIPAKKVPAFRAGKMLKEAVNK